ncbi:hypothetical protein [Candidatus Enterovibrio escicola]|uniref:hypothetical protein n=1 Tax=Candidatus Enterovibrio escicola TaxID=1927127 RepID=UPI001238266A|nr:hypothetical protein [Candidatus Enterovibrio escacola]
MSITPNFSWYSKESKKKCVSPRCPHATPQKCYKYYASIYLLGELSITSKVSENKVEELDKYWNDSDIIPLISEHEPTVTYSDSNSLDSLCNFCPEVSFEAYGLFTTYMHRYIDDIDREYVCSRLEREGNRDDWRWSWMSIKALHYTECDNYSKLPHIKNSNEKSDDLLEMKPGFLGFNINLKVLFKILSSDTDNTVLKKIKTILSFLSRRS